MSQSLVEFGSVQNFAMKTNIIGLWLLTLSWLQCVQSQLPNLPELPANVNCLTELKRDPIDLTAMSGYWYEIVRAPNMDIMKCLNVSVPSTADTELNLQLEYIETINPKKPWIVKETLSFPWDENTSNGVFQLQYDSAFTLTYKVQFSDPKRLVILCGYAASTSLPIVKVFARQPEIPKYQMVLINNLVQASGYADDIIWTEQSPDRCNAAVRPEMAILTIFALAIIRILGN
ncbi:uncharacterized protein LOC6574255 [Drosophila mojavensis]|uniref:Uncharacterized protein n=1 Tax=Drosophila mojavensis TaxID=7230 RepID=B4KB68_DROMO|nr:uncharacterized protein LOC6574255 [Drosophila mojavensis]EDW15772.2 uncharacterized protein Dmoj_GI10159 [Drosophila mojavensis]